jgi:hypothetical protein
MNSLKKIFEIRQVRKNAIARGIPNSITTNGVKLRSSLIVLK